MKYPAKAIIIPTPAAIELNSGTLFAGISAASTAGTIVNIAAYWRHFILCE
jgi:hypothetical protein